MLTKAIVRTEHAPSPKGPVLTRCHRRRSGLCCRARPCDRQSGELRLGDIRSECEITLKNTDAILTGLENVVGCRVYLADLKDFAAMNEIYRRFFPGSSLARTTVGAGSLLHGIKIEIDAVALAGDRKRGRAHRAGRSRSAGSRRKRRR